MAISAPPIQQTSEPGGVHTLITPRERLIQRLLWASIAISVLIFVCSMVQLGWNSLFLSPCVTVLCVAYDITLLVRTAKERKRAAKEEAHGHPLPSVHHTVGPSSRPPLPSVCRKPSIILSFVFAFFWLAAMAVNITWLAWGASGGPMAWMAPSILEIIFIAMHIPVLGMLGTLCTKERRRFLGGDRHLKWYQLGQYN